MMDRNFRDKLKLLQSVGGNGLAGITAELAQAMAGKIEELEEQIKDLRGEIQGNDEEWK